MPPQTWTLCRESNAILFGAVGLPARDSQLPPEMRPERRALLPLRKEFGLSCNIRPVRVYPELTGISPLKDERIGGGVNLTFFRELVGGDYFGERREDPGGTWAEDTCYYTSKQIEEIARMAFLMARKTGEKVTSIDKANILGATGTFWRKVVQGLHDREFTDVKLEHQYVDAFNLYLFTRPGDFGIILASNAHGDILSDGAAGLAGSMGLLPSASLNPTSKFGLYEPAGGSAPDIMGKNIANPIALILSIALMFRHSFNDNDVASAIESAVRAALKEGYRTKDLVIGPAGSSNFVDTTEMVSAVMSKLE